MKKFISLKKIILVIIFVLLIGVSTALVFSYKNAIKKPISSNEDIVMVEVRHGEGFYEVLDRLHREKKLSNKYFIKLDLMLHKNNVQLQEGIYEVKSDITLDGLLETLKIQKDDKNLKKLTIPEGYTIDQIAEKVEQEKICSKDEFLQEVKNYELPSYVKEDKNKRYNLEGFLYPDTYLIKNNATPEYIIKQMLNRFVEVLGEVKNETGINVENNDIDRTIIIASMIEKEARFDEDRPLISSVIYNRLKEDMKLQLDATIIYSLGYHVDRVLNKHLEIDSPYNTYKYKGLPIGAIGNPGKASIKAALLPSKTDYLFYILQENGYHYFSNNYDDFLSKKKELGY
ncbi:endolytic transglycosylase MltG [Clostridium uliginosum]|uniref:Endolytic murein transglycosylase n=1 Tax=Clostridium uliginosum TaxID=119641 RepID=A0A1I1LKT7_9CLOT|nr:endolytic transglycosylase MltG [Clostridium uliginosum]SFC71588.1 UPF0755 protein [Clostridium uliginosum]